MKSFLQHFHNFQTQYLFEYEFHWHYSAVNEAHMNQKSINQMEIISLNHQFIANKKCIIAMFCIFKCDEQHLNYLLKKKFVCFGEKNVQMLTFQKFE